MALAKVVESSNFNTMSSIATPLTHRQFGRLVGTRDFTRELIRDNRHHGPINGSNSIRPRSFGRGLALFLPPSPAM
jgi:hypothetical protein